MFIGNQAVWYKPTTFSYPIRRNIPGINQEDCCSDRVTLFDPFAKHMNDSCADPGTAPWGEHGIAHIDLVLA